MNFLACSAIPRRPWRLRAFCRQGHEPPREPAKLNRRGRRESAESAEKDVVIVSVRAPDLLHGFQAPGSD